MCCGLLACGGYNTGDKRAGMMTRWTVVGGEEAICRLKFSIIAVNGEVRPSPD